MEGRDQYPYDNHHGYPPNGPPTRDLVYPPMPPHPIMLEEELELQHHEIRRLLGENRRLVEDRVALQQDLGAAREEFRRMNIAITKIQKDNEMHARQLIDNGLRLEADVRAAEPLKKEAVHLHDEVKRLKSIARDLYGQVQTLTEDLAKLKDENKQLQALRKEREELHREIMRARDAIHYEKKGNTELSDHKQAMEKNLVSMAREVEKLRAELSNPDIRSRGSDESYGMSFGTYDSSFLHPYGHAYGAHLGAAENGLFYGSSSTPWAELEQSRMNS